MDSHKQGHGQNASARKRKWIESGPPLRDPVEEFLLAPAEGMGRVKPAASRIPECSMPSGPGALMPAIVRVNVFPSAETTRCAVVVTLLNGHLNRETSAPTGCCAAYSLDC